MLERRVKQGWVGHAGRWITRSAAKRVVSQPARARVGPRACGLAHGHGVGAWEWGLANQNPGRKPRAWLVGAPEWGLTHGRVGWPTGVGVGARELGLANQNPGRKPALWLVDPPQWDGAAGEQQPGLRSEVLRTGAALVGGRSAGPGEFCWSIQVCRAPRHRSRLGRSPECASRGPADARTASSGSGGCTITSGGRAATLPAARLRTEVRTVSRHELRTRRFLKRH